MAKKKAVALQQEVNSDEEWNEFLQRPGLLVVDVYSEWSGPCSAMITILRKVKMEKGDLVWYALARNDLITPLARFKGKSEPVWMFIQDGMSVNIVFGANAPQLRRVLRDEVKRFESQEPPKWLMDIDKRGPEEEARWLEYEAVR